MYLRVVGDFVCWNNPTQLKADIIVVFKMWKTYPCNEVYTYITRMSVVQLVLSCIISNKDQVQILTATVLKFQRLQCESGSLCALMFDL